MAISPELEAMLRQKFDELKAELATTINAAFDKVFNSPRAPLPTAPPAPQLPPLPAPPAPPPKQTPTYPPAPSVEALEEVECIQVYKPLRNIRKQPMRQKHRAAEAMPKKSCDDEFFVFGNIIAWPPKFGGTNMRLSRDQHLDAWYTTMLNTHANELAT